MVCQQNDQRLWEAVENNDLSIVQTLLFQGEANINLPDDSKRTLLHRAVEFGYVEIIRCLLLETDIEINAKDEDGNTPLHMAVQTNHPEVVRILLETKGIDIQAKNHEQTTPFHVAALNGLRAITDLFLDQTIDFNEVDTYGNTLLHMAAWNGHADIIHQLLEKEAVNANQQDSDGLTFLHIAAQRGYPVIFNLPLVKKRCPINITDNEGRTPLDSAILMTSSPEIVQSLFSDGAVVSELSEYELFEWCLDTQNKDLFRHALLAGLDTQISISLEKQLPQDWVDMKKDLKQVLEKTLKVSMTDTEVPALLRIWPEALRLHKKFQTLERPTTSVNLEMHVLHYQRLSQDYQNRQNTFNNLEDAQKMNIFYRLQLKKCCPPEVMLVFIQWLQDGQGIQTLMDRSKVSKTPIEASYLGVQNPSSNISYFYQNRFSWR